ncbi:MAG: hypothetical protein IPG47_17090, partial [Thermoflexaceae bacterium]|nr:hypothetical protein [Thermoflexaceae bacterium]
MFSRNKRTLLPASALLAGLAALGGAAVFAASSSTTMRGGDTLRVTCDGARLSASPRQFAHLRPLVRARFAQPNGDHDGHTHAYAHRGGHGDAHPHHRSRHGYPDAHGDRKRYADGHGDAALVSAPRIGGCQVFPADNARNQDVSRLPLHPNSANFIASINAGKRYLHADFGSNPTYGIPYVVVPADQPMVPIT